MKCHTLPLIPQSQAYGIMGENVVVGLVVVGGRVLIACATQENAPPDV